MDGHKLEYSVVVPIYDEKDNLRPLYFALRKVMESLNSPYEIIFVNDGSRDEGLALLRGIDVKPSNLIVVDLDRNYGQSQAMQAGFSIARGNTVITLDGDLQNDPEDIPNLLKTMKSGNFDLVCGWRHDRKDHWIRIFSSKIAFFARRIIAKEKIHDVGCGLMVFKKEVLKGVYFSKGMHRFFTLIMLRQGYKIGEMKVRHYSRRFGKSKYNIHNRLPEVLRCLFRFIFQDNTKLASPRQEYKIKEVIRIRQY